MPDRKAESPEQSTRAKPSEQQKPSRRARESRRPEPSEPQQKPVPSQRSGLPDEQLIPRPERPEHETDAQRRRRRAQFLRELTEARELRDRVQPRRAKVARLRHALRMSTFRW